MSTALPVASAAVRPRRPRPTESRDSRRAPFAPFKFVVFVNNVKRLNKQPLALALSGHPRRVAQESDTPPAPASRIWSQYTPYSSHKLETHIHNP